MAAQIYHVQSDRRRLMGLRIWIAGLWLAAAWFGLGATQASESVAAVEPGGPGVLTKCRNWLVATSCKTYHHIVLPPRIAVGDTIPLAFGSHPKEYAFPVARIALNGRRCVIFSQADGNPHQIDRIWITPCYRANTSQ